MNKILIVEDEEAIANLIRINLQHAGYSCEVANDGNTGADMLEKNSYDLCLFDIMLPGINGYELLEYAKSLNMPVIFLSAKGETIDKVKGLRLGADDYITKPFAIEELLARIRVALKKSALTESAAPRKEETLLTCGRLCLDTARHTVFYGETAVDLTKREFLLLQTLLENKSIVMSRDTLLERVWGYDYMGETNVVDVYVYYLRNKIDDVFGEKIIHTVRGIGYVIKD